MDEQVIAHFKSHYAELTDDELEILDAKKGTLIDEARAALAAEIAQRGSRIEDMRRRNAAEDERRAAAESAAAAKRERRDTKIFRWMLILGAPLVILGLIFRPNSAWITLVSTLTQVVILAAVSGVIWFFRRRRKRP